MVVSPELLDEVTHGYISAMLWANAVCAHESCENRDSGSDCEHTNNHGYGVEDVTAEDRSDIDAFVTDFVLSNPADFLAYYEGQRGDHGPGADTPADYFGHDMALTRNDHGAGFWDRGLGELGDRLTDAISPYGSAEVWIGEDRITFET